VRIFIDCSFVDFSRQPTGIPRVVLKYVETGYRWGHRHGIDVVPVVTTEAGIFPVRPLPGAKPSPAAKSYVEGRIADNVDGKAAAAHLREAESALRAALIDAGLPAQLEGLEAGVSALFSSLAKRGAEAALKIEIGPGDVVFFPAYWHDLDPALIKQIGEDGGQAFILVHDILPITFAKFYQSPWRERFADNLLAAARNAAGMLAVSQYSADGVKEFGRRKGVVLDHVKVVHNGYDPLVEDEATKAQIDRGDFHSALGRERYAQYFAEHEPYLMVGTIEPKKGHIPTIEAFEQMWRDGLDRDLVLVGRKGWMYEAVVNRIMSSEFYGSRLRWFDDLDDVDLYIAYCKSRALIFSSYAEGFGIPLIEAAVSRTPVLCFDTLVAREVAGSFGMFFADSAQLKQHVGRMEDAVEFDRAKAALDGFSWPTWDETGDKLFNYLKARAAG
jgi:glycosyltransferase involved in cell wall biosynthesis